MSEPDLTKDEILKYLAEIVQMHLQISRVLSEKLCKDCGGKVIDWHEKRKTIISHLRDLMSPYEFCQRLPQNEDGVVALSIISHLLKIQYTFAQVKILIDMVRGESFQEVYMDSLSSIASKVHGQFEALARLIEFRIEKSEAADNESATIIRLEREIDEDNIIICRQVSVATGGDSPFICYMMRKIVSELEHISDYLKEIAEILTDF
ncbi:MAG: hypothetical protein K9W43_06635 [Candidatus Thorarchaeota archaeon]|nr:hypothetical protein [Candidatus Thorarchaeota archaeon]